MHSKKNLPIPIISLFCEIDDCFLRIKNRCYRNYKEGIALLNVITSGTIISVVGGGELSVCLLRQVLPVWVGCQRWLHFRFSRR